MASPSRLDIALEAVRAAEGIVMTAFGTVQGLRFKEDASPVTLADEQAERTMREAVLAAFPEDAVFGEEGGRSGTGASGYNWVIDPIDGTMNFIRGIPLFGIELAALREGKPWLGVSSAPALQELLWAEAGAGAYCNGEPIRVSAEDRLEKSVVSFGGVKQFKKRGLLSGFLSLVERARWARGIGDAWSYHLLAAGKIDVMVEAETQLWDIAALTAIVEQAGGKVTDIEGQPIGPESKSILATNGKLHDQTLGLIHS